MWRMMRSEWIKIRRSVIWLLVLVSPLIAALFGLFAANKEGDFPWIEALSLMSVLHAMLFLPLLTGVYASLLCRYEHAGGGWKSMLASPVSRTQVYVVKFILVMLMLAVTQLLLFAALLLVGFAHGFNGPIPWRELTTSFAGGWVACLPLAALQLFASVALQSFAAPLAINVVLTLPNILVANSARFGPYDPWTQPMLAMLPRTQGQDYGAFNISMETLLIVVLGSFCLFFAAGWTYFAKKAV
ncbi:ABC transporter permease [Cohnella zeiphila]|uniref:ABC transporter permease n=1 Tax=Cohnella zeiphila TaxID=2761120 RepID=A0A7X0SKM2_9BACL|nr:ABC transporter permease [Cohnella zeiphila]MBB6730559.1 ABC transporter permease [Cohnella zeiphila]